MKLVSYSNLNKYVIKKSDNTGQPLTQIKLH